MERLTKRTLSGTANIDFSGCCFKDGGRDKIAESAKRQLAIERLAAIEDILGDEYELDRLETIISQRMTMREEVAEKIKLVGNISVERLKEIVDSEKNNKFIPGQEVWVVERDEIGEPDCVSGFVFVAEVGGVAIVHPYLGGCGELDAILHNCLEETQENYDCNVSVYLIEDCYGSRESAELALKGEQNEIS